MSLRQCFSIPVRGVFCLDEIQEMPPPMGFAVFLFTLSLSFDIGNENHISVLNMITKYDMVLASALDMLLKSCDRVLYVIKIRP